MATLQKIRSRGPLLLIVIGLAMLAFILGDAWKIIRPNQGIQYVGTIDGTKITAMEYQAELEKYTDVMKFANNVQDFTEEQNNAIKEEVWAVMVRNHLLNKEAQAIGLTVTDTEVRELIERGTDPILANTPFADETGKFDADNLKTFLATYTTLDPNSVSYEEYSYYQTLYNYWLFIESNIKSSLLYSKYQALVNASIVSNPIAAKDSYENRIKRADVLLASLPYSTLADADVEITSADVKKAYDEKKAMLYTYSENRDIYYIDYEILPSQADREAQMAETNEIVNQLEEADEDYAAILRRAGSVMSFSEVARSANNLPDDVVERLDSVKVGGTFGPYYSFYDDTYNAFKLLSIENGYDSIQFSLMQIIADDEAMIASRADSIANALKKGADFEEIASKYNQSAPIQWIAADSYEPATTTGDNALYINKLNSMKKNEVAVLNLSSATLVIKVYDVKTPLKKYNLAIVKRPAEFSEETSNKAYNDLSLFVAQNQTLDELKKNAEDSNYHLLYYPGFENYSQNISGVAKSHEALRWAFSAQEGEVSRIYEVGNANDRLLVVAVEKIHPRGYRSIEDAAASLKPSALAQKKYDTLKDKLANKSFDELKGVEGVQVDTIQFVNFTNAAYVASASSNEPTIGPSVMNLATNQATLPMKGEGCVFVAKKITPDSYATEFDENTEKLRLRTIASRDIANSMLEELYFQAKIVDERYKIF